MTWRLTKYRKRMWHGDWHNIERGWYNTEIGTIKKGGDIIQRLAQYRKGAM